MSTVTNDRPKTKMKELLLSQIRENDEALRKVDKKKPEYDELVHSVRTHGILSPITVREFRDGDGNLLYALVDGLHRYNAAMDAGLSSIPCHILNMQQGDVLTAQIVANVQRIETKPVEYSKQLVRILLQNPMWTMTDLANKVNKSVQWLSQRLRLVNLPDAVAALVDENKIVLSNAYSLVDLHSVAPDEVVNFLDRAQTMPPGEFAANVKSRVSEIKAARRQGREDTKKDEFIPAPFLQNKKAIKDEYDNPQIAPQVIQAMGATTAEEGFAAAIAWCVHMDPISIDQGRRAFETMKATQQEEREKRKRERDAEKNKNAAANSAAALENGTPDSFVQTMATHE